MEMHARGEDCKNDELKIMQHGVVGVLREQQCEDIYYREQKTACMLWFTRITVQMA
ncbi:hypothetical protein BDR04DRAFT_1111752 [Suillus decipiens]|nr:hypothetical protein BDR04DRAFT_1111752 [Suillus decipiens]